MTAHDTGVTELLRQASDGLTPDVDRLVSGGISRGRSRQRRARIGTTVASLAVIGVVGGLAAVVPHLGGADSAPGPGIATDGATAIETPTVAPPLPAATERALAAFSTADVIATVNQIVGTALAADPRPTDTVVDDPDEKVVYFPYGGMESAVGMGFNHLPSVARCNEMNSHLGGSCTGLADGTVQLTWGPTLADGVTCQGVSAYRYGYVVWANSCNAAAGKDSPPLAAEPPLSLDELAAIATSEVWFG
ncbi:hypothetical protein J2X46_002341 [Nocardioides sp. BE266]|uniref:hypothetical protein n=1 Tax=Nocardioides sp. BE266 TaxID=2817725 RepID=UPI002862CCD2|nr:hypothetical protein [Nocardioides sp. BE266]MDR7253356.1 hypothetical protein [Nocardioides sp. BE266]